MNHIIYIGLPETHKKQIRRQLAGTTPDEVIDKVCSALEISREELIGPCRKRVTSEARFIAIGLITDLFPLTLKAIGQIFNRDHSTVIYARETFRDLFDTDREFRRKVALIKL